MQNIVVPLNSTWLTSQNGTVFIQEQSWTDSKRSKRQRKFQTIFHSTWFSNNTLINKQNSKVSEIHEDGAVSQAKKLPHLQSINTVKFFVFQKFYCEEGQEQSAVF